MRLFLADDEMRALVPRLIYGTTGNWIGSGTPLPRTIKKAALLFLFGKTGRRDSFAAKTF
jgi:hypothetical protein